MQVILNLYQTNQHANPVFLSYGSHSGQRGRAVPHPLRPPGKKQVDRDELNYQQFFGLADGAS
jgi:hypothetical protein